MAHAVYPLQEGQATIERVGLIGELVKDFIRKNRISPTGIFLGIPRAMAILKYIELPSAVKENLRETLGYEMERYVPFSINEVYFDYQVVQEDKETGTMKILLIVIKKEFIEPYLELSGSIGTRISGVEISSTALANYFSYHPDTIEGDDCALIYLRDDYLEIDLFRANSLDYSRSIRVSELDDNLPKTLLQELKTLREELGQHQGQLETLICTAGGDEKGLHHLGEEEEIEPRLLDLSRTGIPSFAMIPAFGLALKGLQKVPMEINLLPIEYRKKASRIGYYLMLVLVTLMILSALAWGGGDILYRQLHLTRLNEEIGRLSTELGKVDRLKKECQEIEDRIDFLNSLQAVDVTVLRILKDLTKRIPKSAYLTMVTYSDKDLKIEGVAKSSSGLIPLLEKSPLFSDVAFESSIRKTRDSKEQFRIKLKID